MKRQKAYLSSGAAETCVNSMSDLSLQRSVHMKMQIMALRKTRKSSYIGTVKCLWQTAPNLLLHVMPMRTRKTRWTGMNSNVILT